jgi:hypothetical protein
VIQEHAIVQEVQKAMLELDSVSTGQTTLEQLAQRIKSQVTGELVSNLNFEMGSSVREKVKRFRGLVRGPD